MLKWKLLLLGLLSLTIVNCRARRPTGQIDQGSQSLDYCEQYKERCECSDSVCNIQIPGLTKNLNNLWASADDNLWIVGDSGTLIHFNGQEFINQNTDQYGNQFGYNDFHAITLGNDSGFVMGTFLFTLQYNNGWKKVDLKTTTPVDSTFAPKIYNLWGSYDARVFATAQDGIILEQTGPTSFKYNLVDLDKRDFYSVHGNKEKQVWAVGEQSVIAHFDGQTWKKENIANYNKVIDLNDVYALSENVVISVGEMGTVLMRDNDTWKDISKNLLGDQETRRLQGVCAKGSRIFIIGEKGTLLMWDAELNQLKDLSLRVGYSINEIWCDRTTSYVWAVADQGHVIRIRL